MSVAGEIARQAVAITGFVAVMMLAIEYINVLTRGSWQMRLAKHRWGQYVLGAFLGAIPGCLGAFAVVGMYTHGALTHGAVVAAMVATMGDESFVMFAMMPGQALVMHAALFVIGLLAGALADAVGGRWMRLMPAPCHDMRLHAVDECRCFPGGEILSQWAKCSAARAVLAFSLLLFLVGAAAGWLGPEDWNWIRVTIVGTAMLALWVVATVPDHFLEKHLWEHVARRHVPKVFLWTFGALAASEVIGGHLQLDDSLGAGKWLVLAAACLVGLIPESGPHLIFLTLYAQGSVPLSVLVANSIVQDGHGMLPLLAHSRGAFIGIKLVNLAVGILVGSVVMALGW